jgi:uncharacterized lipoprotein YajG
MTVAMPASADDERYQMRRHVNGTPSVELLATDAAGDFGKKYRGTHHVRHYPTLFSS